MDSDAAHRMKESNPSDDNSLDVTLLPQNISDNMLFHPNADLVVEWNHERNEVPELLASHGVTLELWQKWFDQMEGSNRKCGFEDFDDTVSTRLASHSFPFFAFQFHSSLCTFVGGKNKRHF
jgi:hypothetical protein